MPRPAIDVIYGLYLIPPPPILAPLSIARDMLEREFGARVANRFMAHVTIKGFFKVRPEADFQTLVDRLDELYAGRAAFQQTLRPPAVHRGPLGSSVLLPLEQTAPLMELQRATWQAIEPFVSDDCPFTPDEQPATRFHPHLTLIQYGLPADPVLEQQAMELCRHLTAAVVWVPWTAQNLQLIRFTSGDWLGHWWETHRFEQLKGWRLVQEALAI